MGRGRRAGASALAPASGGRARPKDEALALVEQVRHSVDVEILAALLNELGIADLSSLDERLSRQEDPDQAPRDLLRAAELAGAAGLLDEQRAILAAAARAYSAHAECFARAAERPRKRADQMLMQQQGVSWRDDEAVGAQLRRHRAAAKALASVVAGEHDIAELFPGLMRPPRVLRKLSFREQERIAEALGPRFLGPLRSGDLASARARFVEALQAFGLDEAATAAQAAPEFSFEVASRIVRADDALGKPASWRWQEGIAGLDQEHLDRLGLDRLSGPQAEALLALRQRRGFHALDAAQDVASFEDLARRIMRNPRFYHHSHMAERAGVKTVNVPVADAASFRSLARHYADHPAFAGFGILASVVVSDGRSELAVGFRLVFSDELEERREVWAVLTRAKSAAKTLAGRARACQLDEVGLSEHDISAQVGWERAPVSAYYREGGRVPRVEPVRMSVAKALPAPEPRCDHQSANWAPTPDGEALRLSCDGCDRMSLALVPRHQLPEGSSVLPALGPLDEERYLALARFHAILRGREETASSFAEMRARDGVVLAGRRGVAAPPGSTRPGSFQGAFTGRR